MSQFSRRAVIKAIDVLCTNKITQGMSTRFLLELGPEVKNYVRGENVSALKRMNDLVEFVDCHPDYTVDDEPLKAVIVERALSLLPSDQQETRLSMQTPLSLLMDNFKHAFQQDGFVVTVGDLRPVLPADIRLPGIKTELERRYCKSMNLRHPKVILNRFSLPMYRAIGPRPMHSYVPSSTCFLMG